MIKKIQLAFLLFFISNLLSGQIQKMTVKAFLDNSISKQKNTIQELEKQLSTNDYYHSLLMNKAVRFKMFLDAQNYVSNLYSNNCVSLRPQFNLANIGIKNAYDEGAKNASYLFKIAELKDKSFKESYSSMFQEGTKQYDELQNYSEEGCKSALLEITNRSRGIFSNEMGANILFLNFATSPERELENNFQLFSSISNLPNADFLFTLKVPKSWTVRNKKDFSYSSTVAFFEPSEKFLNSSFSISLFAEPDLIKKTKKLKLSDNVLLDELYSDKETLSIILAKFNQQIDKCKVEATLFNYGNIKFILYTTQYDMGKLSKNDLLDGKYMKSIGAIAMKDGHIFNLSGGGLLSDDGFNTYNYYSKLFYSMITSLKFKENLKSTIYLTDEDNMKIISVTINNNDYKFLLDTGASDIVINKKILANLLKDNFVSQSNFIKSSILELADGTKISAEEWIIPEIKISNHSLKNIAVYVVDSYESSPLFGMNGLKELNVAKLNLSENEIILNQK